MAKAKKTFPKQLYVSVQGDRGQEYFQPDTRLEQIDIDSGDTKTVAVYDLVGLQVLERKTTVKDILVPKKSKRGSQANG